MLPTGNTLAALTGKWHSVSSTCQRGKQFGKNGAKPCRVDRKTPVCAFCVSTRQWRPWFSSSCAKEGDPPGGLRTPAQGKGEGPAGDKSRAKQGTPDTVGGAGGSNGMTGAKRPGLPCDRSLPGGSPSSAQPLLLLYIVVSVWLCPVCRCRWKREALQVERHMAGAK